MTTKATPIPVACFCQFLSWAFLLLATLASPRPAFSSDNASAGYPLPTRFEEDIEAFEAADEESPPAEGKTLFVGSSSIRMWHDTLQEDMAPLEVIGRGFGGSNMQDVNHYADRIVFPYEPESIVLYEGDNDINSGITPERFAEELERFVERVHERLPDTKIYFLSIKPSGKRWELWPTMQEANQKVQEMARKDPKLEYVDVASVLLGEDGKPDDELFVDDRLHLSREGYLKWRDVVRDALGLKAL